MKKSSFGEIGSWSPSAPISFRCRFYSSLVTKCSMLVLISENIAIISIRKVFQLRAQIPALHKRVLDQSVAFAGRGGTTVFGISLGVNVHYKSYLTSRPLIPRRVFRGCGVPSTQALALRKYWSWGWSTICSISCGRHPGLWYGWFLEPFSPDSLFMIPLWLCWRTVDLIVDPFMIPRH